MLSEGWSQPASPTTLAGTPATVLQGGTSASTTEPAAIRLQCPMDMLPRILAPAPISTPLPTFGWRSKSSEVPAPEHVFLQQEPLLRGATGKTLRREIREALLARSKL